MIRSQHNAWIHALATVVVITAGIVLHITRCEWSLVILAISGVWIAEALNTAFEFLADVTNPAFHPLVGKAKDVAAAGVLVAAGGAIGIGIMVFGSHILELMK